MIRGDHLRAEVIVVGAGPAGAAAALRLARGGRDVVLLDRARFPRNKVCGEYQSPRLSEAFGQLGLREVMEDLAGARIRGLRVVAPRLAGGAGMPASYPDGRLGLGLDRRRMDAALLEGARAAGARVVTGVCARDLLMAGGRVAGVVARRRKGGRLTLRGEMVLGCDGRSSMVARRLGLRTEVSFPARWALSTHMEGVKDLGGFGEMHLLAGGGYCGVAPLAPGVANVSAVVPAVRLGRIRRIGPGPALQALIRSHPSLRRQLGGASFTRGVALLGPLAYGARRLGVPGALLVGDAAGFLDPFTGEGVHRALRSAALAAALTELALVEGRADVSALYEQRHRRLFRRKDLLIRGLALLTEHPPLAGAAGWMLTRRPELLEAIVAVAGDCIPAERVVSLRGLLAGGRGRDEKTLERSP